jgi:uncharacterized protein YjbJ (UPF0337 family)
MDWDEIQANWREHQGKVKQYWGRLTYDDLNRIAGRRGLLLGTLQRHYGRSREAMEREVREFETRYFGDRPVSRQDGWDARADRPRMQSSAGELSRGTRVPGTRGARETARGSGGGGGGDGGTRSGDYTRNEWSDDEVRG